MFSLEDHYWWFVARRALALRLVRQYFPSRSSDAVRMLDVGCGTGVVLGKLRDIAPTIGFDFSVTALEFCRKRDLEDLVQGNAEVLPFCENSFDVLIGLDIYEHLEHDSQAFSEALRVLKPGGILVISVPAFMSLWGPHDVALMHFRRYRLSELEGKLKAVGFEAAKLSYSVFFLFPLVAIIRFFERRKKQPPQASLPALPDWLNGFLIQLQAFEGALLSKVHLPWGSSVIAVGRKPSS
jgi:ubiquinone/menaquinone biosynthesis C-methylase UbiE